MVFLKSFYNFYDFYKNIHYVSFFGKAMQVSCEGCKICEEVVGGAEIVLIHSAIQPAIWPS